MVPLMSTFSFLTFVQDLSLKASLITTGVGSFVVGHIVIAHCQEGSSLIYHVLCRRESGVLGSLKVTFESQELPKGKMFVIKSYKIKVSGVQHREVLFLCYLLLSI